MITLLVIGKMVYLRALSRAGGSPHMSQWVRGPMCVPTTCGHECRPKSPTSVGYVLHFFPSPEMFLKLMS